MRCTGNCGRGYRGCAHGSARASFRRGRHVRAGYNLCSCSLSTQREALQPSRRAPTTTNKLKGEYMRKQRWTGKQRWTVSVRGYLDCYSVCPVEVIAGRSAPALHGRPGGWFTRGGSRIAHPTAYRRVGWSNMVYEASTLHATVGVLWLEWYMHDAYLSWRKERMAQFAKRLTVRAVVDSVDSPCTRAVTCA